MYKKKENHRYNILIVDDEIEYQRVLSIILTDIGYEVEICSNGKEALKYLSKKSVDLIITDLKMPVMDGSKLIREIREEGIEADIIVMTAYGSIESAVDSMRYGASDYFVKSNDPHELVLKVEKLARMFELQRKNNLLMEKQKQPEVFLDSKNKRYLQLLDTCKLTADTGINILILGESGTGKEVIANYIHNLSSRRDEAFVAVNCQAFPSGVIESEIFGHEKGSFTGAMERRIGKFENANYGTVFLDEIGDLPIETQGKLLRVIETRSLERIGSNKEISLDIRFISATNKNMTKAIEDNAFREDLYYRINTLTLEVPPLRERREDLPSLINFFIDKTSKEQKKIIEKVDKEALRFLNSYDYPGNVRELKNIVERMIALSRNGIVRLDNILMPVEESENGVKQRSTLKEARANFEEDFIKESLRENDNSVVKTAKSLDISVRQLWNKISQYEIDLKK